MFKGIAFILAAAGVWVLVNVENLQQFLDSYSRRNQEIEQIELLKGRLQRLKHQEQSLRTNGAESERQARERLNMYLPGERVIHIKRESAAPVQSGTTPVIEPATMPGKTAEKPLPLKKSTRPQ